MARTYPRRSTADRGYGPAHQAARAAAIRAYQPGQPCADPGCQLGGQLWGDPRYFDLGHIPGTGKTAYRGLEHRRCNRSTGATWGNLTRRYGQRWRASRDW